VDFKLEIEDARIFRTVDGKTKVAYQCPVLKCGKCYPKPWRLQEHFYSHTGEVK